MANALLERDDLVVGHGVGLSDDRDQVDFGVQASHEFDIDRLQTTRPRYEKKVSRGRSIEAREIGRTNGRSVR